MSWNSGPMISSPTQPEFSPNLLLLIIQEQLALRGIRTHPTQGMLYTAGIACADVLRALGVAPASAPERRR